MGVSSFLRRPPQKWGGRPLWEFSHLECENSTCCQLFVNCFLPSLATHASISETLNSVLPLETRMPFGKSGNSCFHFQSVVLEMLRRLHTSRDVINNFVSLIFDSPLVGYVLTCSSMLILDLESKRCKVNLRILRFSSILSIDLKPLKISSPSHFLTFG